MKPYIHNPNLYRHHFQYQVGKGLPSFRGRRMQYGAGLGSFLGALARKAVPLLASGVKLAAPHLKQAFKGIAKDVTGKVAQKATQRLLAPKKPNKGKTSRKRVSKRKHVKASTSKDIF